MAALNKQKMQQLKLALDQLNALGPNLATNLNQMSDDALYAATLQSVSTFLGLTVGNPNQLWEKITALTYTEDKLEHLKGGSVGADLKCAKGTVEHKKSNKPCDATKMTTSWVFGGLNARTKTELLEKLLKKMTYKVIFTAIHNETGQILSNYSVDGPFMAHYLTRLSKLKNGKSNGVNLGSAQCKTCHGWHRVLWLKAWSAKKRIWKSLEEVDPDFAEIDKTIPSQCGDLLAADKAFMGIL